MKPNEYDLIFSLGEACSCTETLRKYCLQVFSYPFDWLFGSSFIGRCNILTNNFKDFLKKEDLEYTFYDQNTRCRAYRNKNTDITFNHDFSKFLSFEEAYELVNKKYIRRQKRLLKKIKKSKKVLVVYMESPVKSLKTNTNQEIVEGYSILKKRFGKKIDLLYIKYSKNEKSFEQLANNKITKITLDYKNHDDILHDWAVDKEKLSNVFENYKLRTDIFDYLKIKFKTFLKIVKIFIIMTNT